MAVADNRTLLDTWEANQPDGLSGVAGGTADTEIFIQGSQSYGYYTTTTRDGLLYDAGSAQNWANNTFYFWFNTGIAGLLDIKANGGVAARFCGATVSDWFEVNLAGSDDYPTAIQGGWVMFVVDIEKAKTASNRTNGTPPATNAIRYVGVTTVTAATMPRMADNTWLDAMWRLPQNTPGIIVTGANETWAGIESASSTNAWGTCKATVGGAYAINTPIQFGSSAAGTNGFFGDGEIILWEDWDVDPSFYGFSVDCNSGSTCDFDLTNNIISASSIGQRWFYNTVGVTNDVHSNRVTNSTFIHGGDINLNGSAAKFKGTRIDDCTYIDFTAASSLSYIRESTITDSNTTDGVAFIQTDSANFIDNTAFTFSDGHAIELVKNARQVVFNDVIADDGGSFTNDTLPSYDTFTNDMTLLPATPAVNDAYYFGNDAKFDEIELNVSTAGSGTWTITWEYYNGTAWAALSGVTDGTTGFTTSGTNSITYTVPTDWAVTSVNGSANEFFIRGRVSAYTSITTQPLGAFAFAYLETKTFTFDGNSFTGFGADGTNDAAIYNNSGGNIVLNLQNVAAVPTIRNGTGATTSADITVTVKVTVRDADTLSTIDGVRVLLEANVGGDLPYNDSVTITRSGSTASVSHTAHGLSNGDKVKIKGANQNEYNGVRTISNVTTNAYDYTVTGTPTTPATGTITSTAVILDGTTSGGSVQDTGFKFTSSQPVTGKARKGTATTYYKTATITGNIVSSGFDNTVVMVKDE